MLRAYCDCSEKEGNVTITSIVVTNKIFIDYTLRVLTDVRHTAHAELRAIEEAMDIINKHFDTPQDIIIYSDCASIVSQFASSLETKRIPHSRVYYSDWVRLMEKCEGHTVHVRYVKGHIGQRSYHTICDHAARTLVGMVQ